VLFFNGLQTISRLKKGRAGGKNKSLPLRPDLQALVACYGGFSKVPVEAWVDFDRRLARYRYALARR
jgi:hypothetical protein